MPQDGVVQAETCNKVTNWIRINLSCVRLNKCDFYSNKHNGMAIFKIGTITGIQNWEYSAHPGAVAGTWTVRLALSAARSNVVQFTWWYAVVEGVLNSFEFQSRMTAIQYEWGHFTAPLYPSHQLHGRDRLQAGARIFTFPQPVGTQLLCPLTKRDPQVSHTSLFSVAVKNTWSIISTPSNVLSCCGT
jgi:hypothetical protein